MSLPNVDEHYYGAEAHLSISPFNFHLFGVFEPLKKVLRDQSGTLVTKKLKKWCIRGFTGSKRAIFRRWNEIRKSFLLNNYVKKYIVCIDFVNARCT